MKPRTEKRMIFRCPMSASVPVFLLLATLGAARADQERPEESVQVVPDRIAVLVQDLGSDDFSRREKAQSQLRRLGLAAFDQLCDAQESDDIEIALRARYLLRSLAIRWADEDDPAQVKALLRGYDGKADAERRNLMEQLAVLPAQQGITALCRLVRFEPSNVLSKHAALLIMQQEFEDPKLRAEIATLIRDQVTLSRRPAADWLRVFMKTLESPEASLSEWGLIVENEQSVFQYTPEKSSIDTVRDLLRWYAGLLDRCGRGEQALAAVRATINLLDGTRFQLLETVNWLIHRQAWDTVEEVASRFPERFEDSAELLYRLAESRLRNDQEQLAQESGGRALAMHPDDKKEHLLVAVSLQDRGLFAWAEREYRFVLDSAAVGSEESVRGRFLLSEMLHDLERDQEAGGILKDLVAVLEKDDHAQIIAKSLGREIGGVRSRMHHFYAEHARRENDFEKQKEYLTQGIENDPTDADVLIAMYRLDGADEAWREKTRKAVAAAAEEFRNQAQQYRQRANESPNEELRSIYRRLLASAHNQFAWLVSNTEGDLDEALQSSRQSLELRPNTAGFLDTLGRCYFAKGDYENAVKSQARAVELEPHSGQIRRQLERFQEALDRAGPQQP